MKFYSLREIEGKISPHTGFLERELERRKEPFSLVDDLEGLCDFIGGERIEVGIGEDWALKKEFFPGVGVVVLYFRGDEEFPPKLRCLFTGERIREMKGEDLVELSLCLVNHILRFIRMRKGTDNFEILRRI